MNAVLALEDGTVFHGRAAGAEGEARGEVVFNTSLTGYQGDPHGSPRAPGQIVTMTCAEIGDYSVSAGHQSRKPQAAGFIIRDESPMASNWRATAHCAPIYVANNIVAISDIDTQALTRRLRSGGVMRGVIDLGRVRREGAHRPRAQSRKWKAPIFVAGVTCDTAFDWPAEDPDEFGVAIEHRAARRLKIAAYDFGMKWNILRRLSAHGCDVRVYPARTPAADVLASRPDGVFLSNGPGNPAPLTYAIESAKAIVAAGVPTFGICLGHRILGLAAGGYHLQAEVRP